MPLSKGQVGRGAQSFWWHWWWWQDDDDNNDVDKMIDDSNKAVAE